MKAYYSTALPFITSQPPCREDVAPSVLETNMAAVTAANEWENEWNQSGLGSRLSKEVHTCMHARTCTHIHIHTHTHIHIHIHIHIHTHLPIARRYFSVES